MSKANVRVISRQKGLQTWDKPASPCLSSRIPYGEPIVLRSLHMVERAETLLSGMGFRSLRVRKQGETARIELLPEDISRMLDSTLRESVVSKLREIGFTCVALDLEGVQSGKLNRSIVETVV